MNTTAYEKRSGTHWRWLACLAMVAALPACAVGVGEPGSEVDTDTDGLEDLAAGPYISDAGGSCDTYAAVCLTTEAAPSAEFKGFYAGATGGSWVENAHDADTGIKIHLEYEVVDDDPDHRANRSEAERHFENSATFIVDKSSVVRNTGVSWIWIKAEDACAVLTPGISLAYVKFKRITAEWDHFRWLWRAGNESFEFTPRSNFNTCRNTSNPAFPRP